MEKHLPEWARRNATGSTPRSPFQAAFSAKTSQRETQLIDGIRHFKAILRSDRRDKHNNAATLGESLTGFATWQHKQDGAIHSADSQMTKVWSYSLTRFDAAAAGLTFNLDKHPTRESSNKGTTKFDSAWEDYGQRHANQSRAPQTSKHIRYTESFRDFADHDNQRNRSKSNKLFGLAFMRQSFRQAQQAAFIFRH
ncbi:hypothetical protein BJ508DRAFT_331946 [Ascobolus immersus RN42]|uniref:Uncharacterized protein n=1 Tax=Ascobolus immersus RN42 TaxID=1160509 RepID=A0A3N4HUX4_ASCIM|nr:hypothetical protein BJ508DRAFT_331946 [Ascobolus immersus RN42]